jgi:hypothetical protein
MGDPSRGFFGLQFHPELDTGTNGLKIINNFLYRVCHAVGDYDIEGFADDRIARIRERVGNDKIILAAYENGDYLVYYEPQKLSPKVHAFLTEDDTVIWVPAYEYLDEDKVVENAYILVNGENVKEISTKSGNTTITGLDFENESYVIKLVIEYLDEAEKVIKVESDTLEYKVVTPEPQPNPEKPKGGCGKKGVELFISLMAASAVIGILLRKRK